MPTAPTPVNPPKVFISYSHKDEDLLERLEAHLKVLQDQKIITLLHSHRTVPGVDWAKEIEKNLSTAQIVLLLVSVDFLASYYCYRVEFERAMERHQLEAACVIPVILRPCDWMDTPLSKLQALPKGGQPIVKWDNRDDAFVSVTEGIKKVAKKLRTRISFITEGVEITVDEPDFDQEGFKQRLRVYVGVDLGRITISVQRGSVKILIEGDNEELTRIVNALHDPEARRKLFGSNKVRAIVYIQDQQHHSIPLEPTTPNDKVKSTLLPTEILKEAIRAVPAVKYALGVAGIAAAVSIVAGFSVDYKVAVLGTIVMLALMFGLVAFSSFVSNSSSSIRPLALTLAWTFVLLTCATSLCIFTSFFFGLPRPLEAYIYPTPISSPTPLPTPLSTPTAEPSPTSTITTGEPLIVVTERPPYDPVGGRNSKALIVGKVSVATPEAHRIVIYSYTDTWYVQPRTDQPRISIDPDGSWRADIQTGTTYVILLVPRDFQPPPTTDRRPTQLPGVIKWMEIEGKKGNQNSR